jgi:hypothetical protein
LGVEISETLNEDEALKQENSCLLSSSQMSKEQKISVIKEGITQYLSGKLVNIPGVPSLSPKDMLNALENLNEINDLALKKGSKS